MAQRDSDHTACSGAARLASPHPENRVIIAFALWPGIETLDVTKVTKDACDRMMRGAARFRMVLKAA